MNLGTAQVIRANARSLPLADDSVDLVVTSPPYFALRSYQDGGEHYAGQIGDEPTPAEFVDSLIEVTRECMRVLKPSGSLWVNLGDSYSRNGGGGAGSSDGKTGRGARPSRKMPSVRMTRSEAAWLAGVIDSDGSVSIHVNKQPEGCAPSFVAWVRIGQMCPEVVQHAAEVTGFGNVSKDARGVWNWSVSAQQARWVLERIHPWLLIKQKQAAAAIELARHVEDRNSRGVYRALTSEDIAYRQGLRDAVLAWNRQEEAVLDVPAPRAISLPDYPRSPAEKSLIGIPWRYALRCIDDLGLILRAEVIWSKPNGLPESVTDRVRRSHEQWFHFTLQPRYFSAVDEIREGYAPGTAARYAAGYSVRAVDEQRPSVNTKLGGDTYDENPLGKLPGSVWTVPTEPLRVPDHLGIDHFAAFPTEWPKRIISGWSPAGVCVECGEGRRPVAHRDDIDPQHLASNARQESHQRLTVRGVSASSILRTGLQSGQSPATRITGYACACDEPIASPTGGRAGVDPSLTTGRAGFNRERGEGEGTRVVTRWEQRHEAQQLRDSPHRRAMATEAGAAFAHYLRTDRSGARPIPEPLRQAWRELGWLTPAPAFVPPATRPAVVLDPFGGTGTTAMVAKALGRHGISVDMSADYCRLAEWRTNDRNQLAKVLGVEKVDAPDPLQDDLLALLDGGAA